MQKIFTALMVSIACFIAPSIANSQPTTAPPITVCDRVIQPCPSCNSPVAPRPGSIMPTPGTIVIEGIHGGARGNLAIEWLDANGRNHFQSIELTDLRLRDIAGGERILMTACFSGNSGIAERIARATGLPVIAPVGVLGGRDRIVVYHPVTGAEMPPEHAFVRYLPDGTRESVNYSQIRSSLLERGLEYLTDITPGSIFRDHGFSSTCSGCKAPLDFVETTLRSIGGSTWRGDLRDSFPGLGQSRQVVLSSLPDGRLVIFDEHASELANRLRNIPGGIGEQIINDFNRYGYVVLDSDEKVRAYLHAIDGQSHSTVQRPVSMLQSSLWLADPKHCSGLTDAQKLLALDLAAKEIKSNYAKLIESELAVLRKEKNEAIARICGSPEPTEAQCLPHVDELHRVTKDFEGRMLRKRVELLNQQMEATEAARTKINSPPAGGQSCSSCKSALVTGRQLGQETFFRSIRGGSGSASFSLNLAGLGLHLIDMIRTQDRAFNELIREKNAEVSQAACQNWQREINHYGQKNNPCLGSSDYSACVRNVGARLIGTVGLYVQDFGISANQPIGGVEPPADLFIEKSITIANEPLPIRTTRSGAMVDLRRYVAWLISLLNPPSSPQTVSAATNLLNEIYQKVFEYVMSKMCEEALSSYPIWYSFEVRDDDPHNNFDYGSPVNKCTHSLARLVGHEVGIVPSVGLFQFAVKMDPPPGEVYLYYVTPPWRADGQRHFVKLEGWTPDTLEKRVRDLGCFPYGRIPNMSDIRRDAANRCKGPKPNPLLDGALYYNANCSRIPTQREQECREVNDDINNTLTRLYDSAYSCRTADQPSLPAYPYFTQDLNDRTRITGDDFLDRASADARHLLGALTEAARLSCPPLASHSAAEEVLDVLGARNSRGLPWSQLPPEVRDANYAALDRQGISRWCNNIRQRERALHTASQAAGDACYANWLEEGGVRNTSCEQCCDSGSCTFAGSSTTLNVHSVGWSAQEVLSMKSRCVMRCLSGEAPSSEPPDCHVPYDQGFDESRIDAGVSSVSDVIDSGFEGNGTLDRDDHDIDPGFAPHYECVCGPAGGTRTVGTGETGESSETPRCRWERQVPINTQ